MELTRYDRQRIGQLVGAVALLAHAVPAALGARLILGLPMEAGGLVLAPILGGPLALAALTFVVQGVLMATGRGTGQGVVALASCVFLDVLVSLVGPFRGWFLAGAALAVVALGFLASTLPLRARTGR